jgi:hypothetical protein
VRWSGSGAQLPLVWVFAAATATVVDVAVVDVAVTGVAAHDVSASVVAVVVWVALSSALFSAA